MHIRNRVNKDKIKDISLQIFRSIRSEKRLTARPLKDVRKLLENNSFFLEFELDQLVGFIVRERLYKNYYEIKSWFVLPSFRNKGIGTSLLKKATSKTNYKYLIVTFYDDVIVRTQKLGFNTVSLTKLEPPLIIKIVLSRNPKSIVKHFLKNKSTLLFK